MYTEQDILNILNKVIEASKKNDLNKIRSWKKTENKLPEYYPGYVKAVELMNRIKVHSEICGFPEELFKKRSPNMTEEEYVYIKENYKQTTLPVYLDFLSTISRIFHDSNWDVDYGDDAKDDSLRKYVEEGIEIYGSIENYVKYIIPHIKETDANGVIVVKPHEFKTVEREDGEEVIDTQYKYEPLPYYYSSEKVVSEKQGEFIMVETDDHSEVMYGGVRRKIGRVFEFYDDINMWRIEQIGNFIDYKFSIVNFFAHNRGELPYKKLMGVPQITPDGILYLSPFIYVTDILDLVTLNACNLQISINMCVYPYRVMYGNICEFENVFPDGTKAICNSGYVYSSESQKNVMCQGCGGTGLQSRISPTGTMLLKPPTSLEGGDDKFSQAPISFVQPETTTLDFLMKKIADDEVKARKILHLTTSNTQITSQNQEGLSTATGMMLDMKAMSAFIKPISDQIFMLYEFIVDTIRYQRYGEDYPVPVFSYPISFDFHSEQDYLTEISAAQKSNIPPAVIDTVITRYLRSTFYNEKNTARMFNLVVSCDRLLSASNDDILLKYGRGLIEKYEVIIHDSAISIIEQLLIDNPNFYELPFEEQRTAVFEAAKAKAEAMTGPALLTGPSLISKLTGAAV